MTWPKLASHFRVPLFRSGYALAGNTIVTSALGALYWVLAARLLDAEDVGVGAALISAMTLLTTISLFNLDNALNRFVPPAGSSTRKLVGGSYAVAVPLAALAAGIFLAGLDWWAPGLDVVRESPWTIAGFIAATMLWTVFVLQDAALAGLRRATWLPIENGIYGVAKILILAVLVGWSARFSVFVSWTLPLLVLVPAVNHLMFRKAIPHHVAATSPTAPPFRVGAVARYALQDYVASALWTATAAVLPIVVLEMVGAEASAYFYLAWTIAYTLYLVSRSTGVALITEGALEPAKLVAYSRQVILQTGALIVPIVLVVMVAAPLILTVFGPDYAREGSTVLRLLVLAAVPNVAVTLFISIARVEYRMRSILYVNAAMLGGVLALSFVLLPRLGVVGVGWAWLIVQSVLAIVLLATGLRRIWIPMVADVPVVQRIAAAVGPGRRLGRESAAAAAKLPALLARLAGEPGVGPLHVVSRLPTELDLVVAALADPSDTPTAVIKLAATEGASDSVNTEADALAALAADTRLGEWLSLVPPVLARGEVDGLAYFVEGFVDGVSGREVAGGDRRRSQLVAAAADAIAPLHAATGSMATVGPSEVDLWVHRPLADLVDLLGPAGRSQRSAKCDALAAELEADLLGKRMEVCWIHGDYWLGNLLIAATGGLSGIVDWGQTEQRGLGALDILHLVLTSRVMGGDLPFGSAVIAALADDEWSEVEAGVLADVMAADRSGRGPQLRTLVLLTWLRHVASNVRKSYRYRRSNLWMGQNVDDVLDALG